MSSIERRSMEQLPQCVNIVLLGKTGSGKSASGNTILHGNTFAEGFSPASVTRTCQLERIEVDRQQITVIDTVGLPDTAMNIKYVQSKIEQMFDCTHNGIDVFLLVIKLGQKFTQESRTVVQSIQENFGAMFSNHTIVLFTCGDELQVPIENYLSMSQTLQSVVYECSGGFHVFNNRSKDQEQVTELLEKINRLRVRNRYRRYTKQDYKKTQNEILCRKFATGALFGGAGVAVGAVAAKIGVVELPIGRAATGGAALAAAACAGVYFLTRR